MTTRRPRVLALLVGLVLALTAGGCAATEPAAGELVILTGRDTGGFPWAERLAAWNSVHPEAPARAVELPAVADQQHDAMVKDAQAEASAVDVYALDVTWVAEFAANDYVSELDGYDTAPFQDRPLQTAMYRGQLYAVPYTTDVGLLLYRKDLYPSAPDSWEALSLSRLVVPGLQPAAPGRPAAVYAGQLGDYEGLTVNVLEVDAAVAPPGQSFFQAGMPALRTAVELLRPHPDENPPVVLADALTYDENASFQALRDGKVAALRTWPVWYRPLTTPTAEDPGRAARYGVAQIPGGKPVLGGQDLAVSTHSDQPAKARELIGYLTNEDSQQKLFAAGVAPVRRDTYTAPGDVDGNLARQVNIALQGATQRPDGPCYSRFSTLLHRRVHDALSTGAPLPDDLMDRLQRVLNCQPEA